MTEVVAALLAGVDRRPDGPALTDPQGRTLTHSQLAEQIRSAAEGLRLHGFQPGERLLFSIRPSTSGIVLALGCVAAGGTVVFADPGAGRDLFATRMGLAGPSWAAAESLLYAIGRPGPGQLLARRRGLLIPDLAGLPVRHIHSGRWLPGVPRSALSLRRLLAAPAPELAPADPDQPAVVVFTSGTTAAPKAVVHTRGTLGAAIALAGSAIELTTDDEVFTDQFLLGLPTLAAGAHWRLPPFGFSPRADPASVGGLIGGATVIFAVPADLAAIGRAVADGLLPRPERLQMVITGGAPVTRALVRLVENLVPADDLIALYGMTEMLPIAATSGAAILDHHCPGDPVGAALPGVRALVADDGELWVSGPHLTQGYLGQPPITEHATGDLARFDDGRLVLLGRKKDMLIRGTTNIYPSLYEPSIAALPGVGEAAIVGVPDDIGDESVVLILTPDQPPAGSSTEPVVLAGHQLAEQTANELPGLIDAAAMPDRIIVLDTLPRAGRNLKIDRDALRRLVSVPVRPVP